MWSFSNHGPQQNCWALHGIHDNRWFQCCRPVLIATEKSRKTDSDATCRHECSWELASPISTIISANERQYWKKQKAIINRGGHLILIRGKPCKAIFSWVPYIGSTDFVSTVIQTPNFLKEEVRYMQSPRAHSIAKFDRAEKKEKKKKLAPRSGLGPLLLFTTVALSVLPLILKTHSAADSWVCLFACRIERGDSSVCIKSSLSPSPKQPLAHHQQNSVHSSYAKEHAHPLLSWKLLCHWGLLSLSNHGNPTYSKTKPKNNNNNNTSLHDTITPPHFGFFEWSSNNLEQRIKELGSSTWDGQNSCWELLSFWWISEISGYIWSKL